jgi:hypothetical protein
VDGSLIKADPVTSATPVRASTGTSVSTSSVPWSPCAYAKRTSPPLLPGAFDLVRHSLTAVQTSHKPMPNTITADSPWSQGYTRSGAKAAPAA